MHDSHDHQFALCVPGPAVYMPVGVMFRGPYVCRSICIVVQEVFAIMATPCGKHGVLSCLERMAQLKEVNNKKLRMCKIAQNCKTYKKSFV